MVGKIKDISGQKFGRLTVVALADRTLWRGEGKTAWVCRCDCGQEKILTGYSFTGGGVKSCGCLQRESATVRATKHGHRLKGKSSAAYSSWRSMMTRCENKNHHNYKNYGGRGITVCDRWKGVNGFRNFLEDMGNPPSERHTIDRIDSNGDYTPQNCRWATPKQQQRNKRSNRFLEFNGQRKTLIEWAEITRIHAGTISSRLKKGWSVERSLTTPVSVEHSRCSKMQR